MGHKAVIEKGPSEILPGERSEVSRISVETPDRPKEVVIAKGMNDSQFQGNPQVTLQHTYQLPPITGYSVSSNVLLQDSAFGLEKFLMTLFARAIAWFEDFAFLQGKGVGKPQGILGASATISVNRQGANLVQFLDVANTAWTTERSATGPLGLDPAPSKSSRRGGASRSQGKMGAIFFACVRAQSEPSGSLCP
jgi:hypothetical protein